MQVFVTAVMMMIMSIVIIGITIELGITVEPLPPSLHLGNSVKLKGTS